MNVTCNDVDARHLLNLMLSWSAAAVICSASSQQTHTPADQEFLAEQLSLHTPIKALQQIQPT